MANTVEKWSVADVMSYTKDTYLILARENYLDDNLGAEVRDTILNLTIQLVTTLQSEVVLQLLSSPDWREAIIGIHCAIVMSQYGRAT